MCWAKFSVLYACFCRGFRQATPYDALDLLTCSVGARARAQGCSTHVIRRILYALRNVCNLQQWYGNMLHY